MKLKYSTAKKVSVQQLDNLFRLVGWRKRGKKWNKVLYKSSFVYSVWDGKTLVGFGRIIEDGVMCMFYDIGVHPKYRKIGIGKKIMNKLISQVRRKKYASIGLFTWEDNKDNIEFYKKFGFVKVNTGMELVKHMRRE